MTQSQRLTITLTCLGLLFGVLTGPFIITYM
jgi:hypothetical protein